MTTRWRARSWNAGSLVELGVGLLVEAVEIAERQPVSGDVLADVEQVLDEHAERAAPVADVVLADDVVADERQHAHERVADHRRAQVADVHLLGDVRRRVVDDDRALRRRLRHAEAVVGRDAAELAGEEVVVEREVHEARPGDLELLATPSSAAGVDDRLGDLARVARRSLGERERPVDLGVGAIRRPHDRIHTVPPAISAKTGRAGRRRCQGVGHGAPILPARGHSDQLEMEGMSRVKGSKPSWLMLFAAGVLDARQHQRRVDVVAAVHGCSTAQCR